MDFHVCWFQADAKDARTIKTTAMAPYRQLAASSKFVVTGGASHTVEPPVSMSPDACFSEWTHLVLSDVDGVDLHELGRLLAAKRKGGPVNADGKVLVRGKITDTPFIFVSLVDSSFVRKLGALNESAIRDFARKWSGILNRDEGDVSKLLRDMVAFARQAERAEKTVLQLDVL